MNIDRNVGTRIRTAQIGNGFLHLERSFVAVFSSTPVSAMAAMTAIIARRMQRVRTSM